MSNYTQLLLGLRSLLVRIAVFVVLAGVLAWMIGGSIFPGSQVVNFPSFPWRQHEWHLQVTGNGSRAAPVRWRMYSVDATGTQTQQEMGIPGAWRRVAGPVVRADGLLFAAEAEVDGTTGWWIASMSNAGVVEVRAAASALEAHGVIDAAGGAQ